MSTTILASSLLSTTLESYWTIIFWCYKKIVSVPLRQVSDLRRLHSEWKLDIIVLWPNWCQLKSTDLQIFTWILFFIDLEAHKRKLAFPTIYCFSADTISNVSFSNGTSCAKRFCPRALSTNLFVFISLIIAPFGKKEWKSKKGSKSSKKPKATSNIKSTRYCCFDYEMVTCKYFQGKMYDFERLVLIQEEWL